MAAVVEARQSNGLTQRGFAEASGLPLAFVWKTEIGERRVSALDLIRIAWGSGYTPKSLVERALDPAAPLVRMPADASTPAITEKLLARMAELLIKEIRSARERRGWDQRRLSARIKRSSGFISKLETGRTRVDALDLFQIAKALDISVPEVVERVARIR